MRLETRQHTGSEQRCIQSYTKKMESPKPWLWDPNVWLENPITVKTQASKQEAKVTREVLSLAKEKT